jgi:hypothetical protein
MLATSVSTAHATTHLGFGAGVVRRGERVVLWGAAGLWLSGNAMFHWWEVAVGICGSDALARDFPAVTLPALITLALAIWAWRDVTPAHAASSRH